MSRTPEDIRLAAHFGEDDVPMPDEPADIEPGRAGRSSGVTAVDRLRQRLLHGDAIKNVPPPVYRVDGVVVNDSLVVIYGPSGTGKTVVMLDVAQCVATGASWHGRRVEKGAVLYVVAESPAGIGIRVDAWQQANGIHTSGDLHWLTTAVSLLDRVEVEALSQLCAELAVDMVVIDTLARCMVGADENSARDMGLVVAALDRLREATGACVVAVHHSGKAEGAGMRGSSALRAAVNTELECKSAEGVVVLTVTKQKDGPELPPMRFRLKQVAESVVLDPYGGHVPTEDLSHRGLELLHALAEIDLGSGASTTVWLESSGVPKRSFYRLLSAIVSANWCQNVGTKRAPRYTLTEQGRSAVEANRGATVPSGANASATASAKVPPPFRGGTTGTTGTERPLRLLETGPEDA